MKARSTRRDAGLGRNSLLNLLGLGLPLLVGVAAMPPVVAGLGPERFGILGLLWVVLAYLAMLDLGLGRATTRFAAEAMARADDDLLRRVATLTTTVQLVLAVVTGGAVALLAAPLARDVLDLQPGLEVEATRSFLVLAAAAPIIVWTTTFRGLLEAGHRFDLVNAIRAPTSAGNFLVPLVGVWSGWSLVGIVAALVVLRAVALGVYVTACLRVWPALRRPALPDRDTARAVLGFGGWVTVSTVISPFLVYVDRFVIGALVSARAVGYYTAPHEVVSRLAVLPASLTAALFPAFAARPAKRDAGARDPMDRVFIRATKYLLALIAPPLLLLALLAPDVLRLWLGATFARESATVLRWLALGMIANGLAHLPYTLLQARGRPDLTARFHLLELPFYLATLWLFVATWGTAGAAAAWSLRVAVDAALLYGAVLFLGMIPEGGFQGERLPATAVSLGLLALAGLGVVAWIGGSAMRIGIMAALTAIWAVWLWNRGLGGDERREALAAVGIGKRSHR